MTLQAVASRYKMLEPGPWLHAGPRGREPARKETRGQATVPSAGLVLPGWARGV